LASATLTRGDERTDIAVPEGTALGQVLDSLHINVYSGHTTVHLPDGQAAKPQQTLGGDLPNGVLLTVTESAASIQAEKEAAQAAGERAYLPAFIAGTTSLLVVCAELVLFWAPLLGAGTGLDWPWRLGAGVGILALIATMALRARWINSASGLILIPGLVAGLGAAFVTPAVPLALRIGVTSGLCLGFLAVLIIGFFAAGRSTRAAVRFWGILALATGILVLLGVRFDTAAPIIFAVGVALMVLVPSRAVQVPEAELVDLPTLTSYAPSSRITEVQSPHQVTPRLTTSLITDGNGTLDFLISAGVLLSVATAGSVAVRLSADRLPGIGAKVLVVCALLVLLLAPLSISSTMVRVTARLGAVAIIGISLWALAGQALPALTAVGILLGLVVLVMLIMVAVQSRPSPFLRRMGEILTTLATLGLIPGAVLTADPASLFTMVWRALS
jgi:hypothetical protein